MKVPKRVRLTKLETKLLHALQVALKMPVPKGYKMLLIKETP